MSTFNLASDLPQFDVLVIGAGAAGLYASLCLPESLRVGLISKDALKIGASDWAQGGIAAAIAPTDSPKFHREDTLKAGAGLCDPEAVQALVEDAPDCIHNLVELGVGFDRHDNQLALTLEAAHSQPRVLHAADTTGKALVHTLTERVIARPNVTIIPQAFALDLWLHPETGHCQGVQLLYENRLFWLPAGAVVLATGGGGQVFAQTTNPTVSTGDGVGMAWRAGAVLRDLEFFQFHPTALTKPGAPHFLISEAVRGEGAHLVDETGARFAFEYHPSGELAPRDVVSRAIFRHLQKTGDPAEGHVYLDLRPIPDAKIRYRFPNIIQVCQRWGVDVFTERIPVAPAAHYWMGGIRVDRQNRTSIPGLYAVGETASTGVHGANRLASNSLLECLVFAAQLANLDLSHKVSRSKSPSWVSSVTLDTVKDIHNEIEWVREVKPQLQRLMWQCAGISRSQDVLEGAIAQVQAWRSVIQASQFTDLLDHSSPTQGLQLADEEIASGFKRYAEISNLLDIGYLILQSAALRKESRGGHYRADYPQPDPAWQTHTLIQGEKWLTASP